MKKKYMLIPLTLLIFSALLLTGCTQYQRTNAVDNYNYVLDVLDVFLEKGETYEIDFNEQFKDTGLTLKKIVSLSSDPDIFTVNGNKITATGMGSATLTVEIYNKPKKLLHFTPAANVYVIDRNAPDIIEVRTAQDLADMNLNKTGKYILKNDIDLADWGDWVPIGNLPSGADTGGYVNAFKGMFINPDGYKIKNLTIRSAKDLPHGFWGGCNSGLFGSVFEAYIDGIILENLFIDVTDFDGKGSSTAGGIVSHFSGLVTNVVRNCRVSGDIFAQEYAGGIMGSTNSIKVIGCSFEGTVKAETSAGGIAAYGRIARDCHVAGTVEANFASGGIFAQAPTGYFIADSSFSGEVLGDGHKSESIAFPTMDFYP